MHIFSQGKATKLQAGDCITFTFDETDGRPNCKIELFRRGKALSWGRDFGQDLAKNIPLLMQDRRIFDTIVEMLAATNGLSVSFSNGGSYVIETQRTTQLSYSFS